ncbi:DNA repair protein complementing XP-C cells homolog [Anopheles gambiae]|uniref:DNA repair protein complementing XP-C cells homolog n=1 Tax=Anopheles gambiae TaxID=7165 RepID=UPI002AC9A2FB|nr:DNA repair protein complementing XP-C cells homolog [Anopheles gambiae]
MSDEEDILSGSEEGDDFSASEDEWLPTKDSKKKAGKGKSKDESSSAEEEDEDEDDGSSSADESDLDDFATSPAKKKGKQPTSRKRAAGKSPSGKQPGGNKRKRLSPGLRDRLYQQYKKDLLKEIAPSKAPLNSSVTDILQKCQYQRKTKVTEQAPKSSSVANDSDSSGDDHLVDPEKLDLGAKFFDKSAPPNERPSASKQGEEVEDGGPPQFDVNAGMRLSDSSDGEGGERHIGEEPLLPASIPKQAADKLISHINQQSSEFMNFTNLDQFTAKVEEAKKFLMSYQQRETIADSAAGRDADASQTSEQQRENVSSLLAMGEKEPGTGTKHEEDASSDSDWEEVQTGEGTAGKEEEATKPSAETAAGWQVTIELETAQSKRKRREELEMELYIKREINRVKRKNQLNYHKSSVLGAICIGRRLNGIINGGAIRGLLMSIMQTRCAEAKVKWDEKKMKSLAEWYKQEFALMSNEFLVPRNGAHCSFALSLAVYTRKVACRHDYILLFLACLRLAGAQARLVLSANVPPKRPPLSDLCPMSERQIKEKFEKRVSNGGGAVGSKQERAVKAPEEAVQPKSIELKKEDDANPPKTAPPSTVDAVERKEKLPTPAKENPPAPSRRSPRGSGGTVQKDIAQPRPPTTRRKALMTLNIPQLDGGDDRLVEASLPAARRSLRSKSVTAVQAESPGSSPFAKRKSNTPTTATNASKSQTIATRKRKLFTAAQPEVKAVPPPPTPPTTSRRTSARKAAKQAAETKEPKVKRRTVRPDPPSDDDAFEVKTKTSEKKSASSGKIVKKDPKPKVPVIVLEDIANKSTEDDKQLLGDGEAASVPTSEEEKTPLKQAKATRKRATVTRKQKSAHVSDDSAADDSDFEMPNSAAKERNKKRTSSATKAKKPARPSPRQKQAGSEQGSKQKTDLWIEFYNEKSKRWLPFDLASEQIDCVDLIMRNASNPIAYVFGWDNEGHLKDVTARYVKNWNTACRMLRVEQAWLENVLRPFVGEKSEMDRLEEKELNKLDADKPLPKTISELKNHPLYALRRHLLKFEALYPAEPPTLGFIRGEAIYPRECVYTLQTREKWYKQGRVVRPFETAYKVVKCWKYDRPNNNWLKDQPCDIFGLWQTDEFDPPTAENGVVPRNEYGNVELFTEKMLPKGTVHLKLPGLNKVCKRLQIDCAPALTGFDMAKMRVVPVYDGFVVCKEFAEQAVEEWYKEMEKEDQREQEKLEKRVYGNWKRLIKGLLVRRKLQNKYNFDNLAQ